MADATASNGARRGLLSKLFKRRNGDQQLREQIEEIIEEIGEIEADAGGPIGAHERLLLGNILRLRNVSAYDIMLPRADIVAIEVETTIEEVLDIMAREGHSRLPVYRETLDDVVGLVHIKDLLAYRQEPEQFVLADVVRPLQVVAPSMRALDLLLEMRLKRAHMVLVVDEYGGIDGLITIEDLVEEIVGEIEDEHDVVSTPLLKLAGDGTAIADARVDIEDFEAEAGPLLSDEEREEDIDTLGGLVTYLLDRVPSRGELVTHAHSGVVFEVLQADPRRVKRLRIRNLPATGQSTGGESTGGKSAGGKSTGGKSAGGKSEET